MSDFDSLSPEELDDLLNGPALTPPAGIVPNFEHPPNSNAASLAGIILCLVLVGCSALLYSYGRIFQVKKTHISDWVGLAALGVYSALVYVLIRLYSRTGLFIHQWDIQLKNLNEFVLAYTLGVVFYVFTMLLVKAGILLQWIRLFVPTGTRNAFFWICCTLTVFETLFYLAAVLAVIIPCAPFKARVEELATCSPAGEFFDLFSASINLVLDFAILILPQRVIWRLQMSRKRRLGISLIFAIGILACLAATARTAMSIWYYASEDFFEDSTYSLSYLALLPLAEATCAMLVFYIPGTPKALTAVGGSKVAVSLRSWTSSSVQALRSKASRRTLGRPSLQGNRKSSLSDTGENSNIMQLNMPEAKSGDIGMPLSQLAGKDSNDSTNAIVRTTQFSATESYDPTRTAIEYPHDHSWT